VSLLFVIQAIEENGGTVDPSYSNRVTHVLAETQASDACQLVTHIFYYVMCVVHMITYRFLLISLLQLRVVSS